MRIGIVTSYHHKNKSGLGRFFLELLKAFGEFDEKNQYLIYVRDSNDINIILNHLKIKNVKAVKVGGGFLWKEIGLYFAPKSDVYLFNGPFASFCFNPDKSIVLVYDFAYKYFGKKKLFSIIKKKISDLLSALMFKRASKIVAISNKTKKEIIKFFSVESNKIEVIYPGAILLEDVSDGEFLNCPKKFFLYVGAIKERKNVLNLVKAYELFYRSVDSGYKLVITGNFNKESSYCKEIFDFISEKGIQDCVIFTGHVSDNTLKVLYKRASVFIFISLLEGFGFTVLEAMNYGLPVITSNRGSLAEIVDDAALLVDPKNTAQISSAMEKSVVDSALMNDLSSRGRVQVSKFTWEITAIRFVNLFDQTKKL